MRNGPHSRQSTAITSTARKACLTRSSRCSIRTASIIESTERLGQTYGLLIRSRRTSKTMVPHAFCSEHGRGDPRGAMSLPSETPNAGSKKLDETTGISVPRRADEAYRLAQWPGVWFSWRP